MRVRHLSFAVLVWACCALGAHSAPSEADARSAATRFGDALTASDTGKLKPLLPARGTVYLHLDRLGPEDGYFGASQVAAVLGMFLKQGSASEFKIDSVDHEPSRLALVRTRVAIVDTQGHSGRIGLHLTFRPEGERWVLREIRETPP